MGYVRKEWSKNMKQLYRSPYEAYPFLCDTKDNLQCDFELLTDELASRTGLLRAKVMRYAKENPNINLEICEELTWVCEIIYHINPTLRTHLTVTKAECEQLKEKMERLQEKAKDRCKKFVLPMGSELACEAHLLRVEAKKLVRLIYHYIEYGNEVPDLLLDIANLLSGYFFALSLVLNLYENVEEVPFISRNYT